MKRILALTLVALMLFAFLAACGKESASPSASDTSAPPPTDSGAPSDTSAPPPIDEVVELTVLNYLDLAAPGTQEQLELIWKAFEDAHPNIKLIREDNFGEPFHQSVEAYAATNTLPDVLYAWPSGRSTSLHKNNLLKDLGPLAARDGLSNFYKAGILDGNLQGGGYLAILPIAMTATHTFIANLEVLNDVGLEPAKSYSELVAQVPVLKAAGYDVVLMSNLDDWVMQSCLFSMVIGRFMGLDWHEQILSGATDFNDPGVIAALNFIKTMYDDGVLDAKGLAISYGDDLGLWATNTAAYNIDGDWRSGNYVTDSVSGEALIAPERQHNFKIGVFPEIDIPGVKVPARTNSVVLGVGWGMNANIPSGSAKEEAAWTLIKWLVGEEVQTLQVRTGGISNPAWANIDFAALNLEPLLIENSKLADHYDAAAVVIDGFFEDVVYRPINEGLQALAIGATTPEQIASLTQAAWEAWKATQ